VGIACDECSFEMEMPDVLEAYAERETHADDYSFKRAKVSIRIETPEQGEEFLRGLIIARSNNSSPLFPELIDGINGLLEPYRSAKLRQEMATRGG